MQSNSPFDLDSTSDQREGRNEEGIEGKWVTKAKMEERMYDVREKKGMGEERGNRRNGEKKPQEGDVRK